MFLRDLRTIGIAAIIGVALTLVEITLHYDPVPRRPLLLSRVMHIPEFVGAWVGMLICMAADAKMSRLVMACLWMVTFLTWFAGAAAVMIRWSGWRHRRGWSWGFALFFVAVWAVGACLISLPAHPD
jgi:hypothetical protein